MANDIESDEEIYQSQQLTVMDTEADDWASVVYNGELLLIIFSLEKSIQLPQAALSRWIALEHSYSSLYMTKSFIV